MKSNSLNGNNQKELKISVEMITFKQELYIQEAVEGVLMQQTDFDFELIIADDCSPDSTAEIIETIIKNHPKGNIIKYFRHKENIGMQANSTFAYNKCRGTYVALCEGDDYWTDPLKLQKQVDFLEANPDYVLCFHSVNILKKDGTIVEDFITKVPENYETLETLARLGNYIHTPSVVFRNIIKEFPFEFELSPIGDYFLYMMLAKEGKLKYIEEDMAVYRYGVGIFSSSSDLSIIKSNLKLFVCLLSYFNEEKINKIIFKRQLESVLALELSLHSKYSDSFVSNHIFFVLLKIVKGNYKFPKRMIKKIYYKLKN